MLLLTHAAGYHRSGLEGGYLEALPEAKHHSGWILHATLLDMLRQSQGRTIREEKGSVPFSCLGGSGPSLVLKADKRKQGEIRRSNKKKREEKEAQEKEYE